MKNIKYIVDCESNKESVILQIQDFEQFEKIKPFLKYHLLLSTLDFAFEYIKIPFNAKKLLKSLVNLADYENQYSNCDHVFSVRVTDENLATELNINVKNDKKTVQNWRNNEMHPYMRDKDKPQRIYDFFQKEKPSGITRYKLNFVEELIFGIEEFVEKNQLSNFEIISLTNTLVFKKKTEDKIVGDYTSWIKEQLKKLEGEPNIEESNASISSREKQKSKE
jgi:hypothetical protein